jgi:hypothetical protein
MTVKFMLWAMIPSGNAVNLEKIAQQLLHSLRRDMENHSLLTYLKKLLRLSQVIVTIWQ